MSKNLELQLLLKLNDQMSRGLKSALDAVQKESKGVENSVAGIAAATARIKTTPIERMTSALRTMRSAAGAVHETLLKVAQAGAAAAAGGYVLKSAAERPMAYGRKLALTANVAYGDKKDVSSRLAGQAEIDAGVRDAVMRYGGSPEQVLETFNTLVGSGAMGEGQAGVKSSLGALPFLQQAATGTGASADDLAKIYIAAKQNMGMSDKEAQIALSKGIKSGQLGGFEIKDMARWLPQQMAMAGSIGMKGMGGFESLISANQATRMTAGTADDAGNNLVNLMAKVTSNDTANDFKKQHVDLYGSLIASMAKGKNSLESFVGILQQLGSEDAKYLELKAKADASKSDPEKQKLYESMADIMMAKGVGKSVQDRQALTGLFGMISPTGKYHSVLKGVKKEQGAEVGTSFDTVSASTDYKVEQAGNKKAFAEQDVLAAVKGPLDTLLDGVNKGAETFPGFTAALYAATVAVTAYTAATVGGSLIGGKGGGILSFLKNMLPGGLAASGAATATTSGMTLGTAALPVTAAAAAGYGAGSLLYNYGLEGTGLGNGIGRISAMIMAVLGSDTAKEALDRRSAQAVPNEFTVNLHLDGEQLATSLIRRDARTASRN